MIFFPYYLYTIFIYIFNHKECRDLIKKLLTYDEDERITINEVNYKKKKKKKKKNIYIYVFTLLNILYIKINK